MTSHSKEYKGKNVDEAIASACTALGVSRDGLRIEIVSPGSAGIFGLCKRKAVVRVSVNPLAVASDERDAMPPQAVPAEARRPERSAKPEPAPRTARRDGHREFGTQGRYGAEADSQPAAPPAPEVLEAVRDITTNLLRLLGFFLPVTVSTVGSKVIVHISPGDDTEALIGRDGSVLDAIQYLLRKMLNQRFPGKHSLSLDVGSYRQDRQKELQELALSLAKKVKESGKTQLISALNPAERRIVHVVLQDDAGIRSSSIGEGLFKKVRIYLPGKGRKRSPGGRHAEDTAADE